MRDSTVEKLQAIAPDLLIGKIPSPCSVTTQRAIAILQILGDGEWHTAAEISKQIGISAHSTRNILKACKQPWGLETHNRKGWMLGKSLSHTKMNPACGTGIDVCSQ